MLPTDLHPSRQKLDLAFVCLDSTTQALDTKFPAFLGLQAWRRRAGQQAGLGNKARRKKRPPKPRSSRKANLLVWPRGVYLLKLWAKHPVIDKLPLEPHLKQRWGLDYRKLRFHGCHAVRHADHHRFVPGLHL